MCNESSNIEKIINTLEDRPSNYIFERSTTEVNTDFYSGLIAGYNECIDVIKRIKSDK